MYIYLAVLLVLNVFFTILLCINSYFDKYFFVISLPIFSLILGFLFIKTYIKLKKSLVFNLFLVQGFFRYTVLPIIFLLSDTSDVNYSENYIVASVIIMIVEMIFLHFIFLFFGRSVSRSGEVIFLKKNIILPILLFFVFLYMYSSGSLKDINFIWDLDQYIDANLTGDLNDSKDSTLGLLLFNPWKVLFFLYMITLVRYNSFLKDDIKKWFYVSFLIFSSSVMVGLSRFSFLLNFLVFLNLLFYINNAKDNKKIIYFSMPLILTFIVIATSLKFINNDAELGFLNLIKPSLLNGYFSGFGNISIGLDLYSYRVDHNFLGFLVNDTFQNIPLLSKYTNDLLKTNMFFNEKIYGHTDYADQIVPLSISGLFHFGYIGVFLYTLIFIIFAIRLEILASKVKFIGYKYVFLYLSLNFSLIFMLNLGSLYSVLFNTLVFVLFPMYLIQLILNLKLRAKN